MTRTRKRTRRSPEGKLSSLLQTVFGKVKQVPQSRAFWRTDVLKKNAKGIDVKLDNPIDLRDIEQKILTFGYKTKGEFLKDIKQLVNNCRQLENESLLETAITIQHKFHEELDSFTEDSDTSSNTTTKQQPPQKRRKTKIPETNSTDTHQNQNQNETQKNNKKSTNTTKNKSKTSTKTRRQSTRKNKSNEKIVNTQEDKSEIQQRNQSDDHSTSLDNVDTEDISSSEPGDNINSSNNLDNQSNSMKDLKENKTIGKGSEKSSADQFLFEPAMNDLKKQIQSLHSMQESQQKTLDKLTSLISSTTEQISNTQSCVKEIQEQQKTDRYSFSQFHSDIIDKINNIHKPIEEIQNTLLSKESQEEQNSNSVAEMDYIENSNDIDVDRENDFITNLESNNNDNNNNTFDNINKNDKNNDNQQMQNSMSNFSDNRNSISKTPWDHYLKPPPPVQPHENYDPKLPADQIDEIEEYSSDSDSNGLTATLYGSSDSKQAVVSLQPPITFLFRTGRIQSLSIIDIGYQYNRSKYRSQYSRQIKLSSNRTQSSSPSKKRGSSSRSTSPPLLNSDPDKNEENKDNNSSNSNSITNTSSQNQFLLSHPFNVGYKIEVRLRGVGAVFIATIKEGKKKPLFEVSADGETTFSGNSPTVPWRNLLKSIGFKGATNGHEFYGFNMPEIRLMLNQAPLLTNADQSLLSSLNSANNETINQEKDSSDTKLDRSEENSNLKVNSEENNNTSNNNNDNNNNNSSKTKSKKKRKKDRDKTKESKKSRRTSKTKKNDKPPEKHLLEFQSSSGNEEQTQNASPELINDDNAKVEDSDNDVFDVDTENEETPKRPRKNSAKKKRMNLKTRNSNTNTNDKSNLSTNKSTDPPILCVDDADDFIDSDDNDNDINYDDYDDDDDDDDDDAEWTPELAYELETKTKKKGNKTSKNKRHKYDEEYVHSEELDEDLEALQRDAQDITGGNEHDQRSSHLNNSKSIKNNNNNNNNNNDDDNNSKRRRSTRQRRNAITNQSNLVIDQLNPDGEPTSHEPPSLDTQPEYSILRRSLSSSSSSKSDGSNTSLKDEEKRPGSKSGVSFASGVTETLNVDLSCPICNRVFSQYHMPTHMSRHYQNDSSITTRKKNKYRNALANQRQRIETVIQRIRSSPANIKSQDKEALHRLRGSNQLTQVYGEAPPKGKAKKKLEFAEPSEIQRFNNDEAVCPICGHLVKADVINDHVLSNCTRHETKAIH